MPMQLQYVRRITEYMALKILSYQYRKFCGLMSTMIFLILLIQHLYIEAGPWSLPNLLVPSEPITSCPSRHYHSPLISCDNALTIRKQGWYWHAMHLTHWPLEKVAVIFKILFWIYHHEMSIMTENSFKGIIYNCIDKTRLGQHWFHDQCCCVVSLFR